MTESASDLYQQLTKFIQDTSNKQSEDLKNYIKTEIDEIKGKIDEEVAERKKLEKELRDIKNNYKILEKELRKNNIIIFNLGYKEDTDILEFTLQKLNQILEINIVPEAVNNIYAIGKKKTNRPIIVKLTSYLTKQTILKNCKKLKGTNISISEQLTLEERRKQKILRQELKKAKSKNLTAYIKGEILYIGESSYTAEELIENEEDSDVELETYTQTQTPSSAPPTPTSNQSIERKPTKVEEQDENKPKKRKITPLSTDILTSRFSPRLNGKAGKPTKTT